MKLEIILFSNVTPVPLVALADIWQEHKKRKDSFFIVKTK